MLGSLLRYLMYAGGKILVVLRNLSHNNGDSQLLTQFPDLNQVTHLKPVFQGNYKVFKEQPSGTAQI